MNPHLVGARAAAIACASMLAACYADDLATTAGSGAAGGTGGTATTTTSPTGTGGAGGGGGAAPFTPAAHDPPPQVVNPGQGPVLTAPRIQIISWASDPFAPEMDKFLAELGATPTWSEQTIEYGVGSLTVLPSIQLTDPPPAQLDDETGDVTPLMADLAAHLSGPHPAWGAADPSTMYLYVLPLGTDVASYGKCCTDFLGYHYEAPVGAGSVPYGIACHCAPVMDDPLTPLQWVTTTVIHEMVEMATDPFFATRPAFQQTDDDHILWTQLTGGEVSDMCEYNRDSNYTPAGAAYMIQRSWSNAAARAGKNPCVPATGSSPYFNSEPVLADVVTLDSYGAKVKTKGVSIPVGGSKTIDVRLWSEAPTAGPWTVTAYDLDDYLGSGKPHLDLTLDRTSGENGDVLHLTIKVLSEDKTFGGEGFVLVSYLNGQENASLGAVGK
jgi:hypothetical protein